MGEVNTLPALSRGYVTFGTLTRSVRINHRTIRVWAQILQQVPNARLVIDSGSYKEVPMQDSLAALFATHGIGRDRLEIGCHSPWDALRGIDIGLDCFPHNSGTTLLETLYMGIPFVTLADRPSMGRLGSSILRAIGRPEWIAQTEAEYVRIAVALAGDLPALASNRTVQRSQMEASPWMDEPGYARKVEAAYRMMFNRWCDLSQPI
jgi:predicted O-linked N-acetylglucosamine transferase (SPINDLY family)